MEISIADVNADGSRWSSFFSRNVTPDYISHSELQGQRALKPGTWAEDLTSVIENENQRTSWSTYRTVPSRNGLERRGLGDD